MKHCIARYLSVHLDIAKECMDIIECSAGKKDEKVLCRLFT